MSSDIQINPELEIIEKLAVVVVFLLAGLYLWQFLGDEDEAENVGSIDKIGVTDSSSHFLEDRDSVNFAQQNLIEENGISVSSSESRASIKNIEDPDVIKNPKEYISAKVDNAISKKQETLAPISASTQIVEKTEVVQEEIGKVELVDKIEKEVSRPTINPISGDLSEGILKLFGTGEPGHSLSLLVNGKNYSEIKVNQQGDWKYEAKLEPGEYSVQVLSSKLNEKISSQAVITRISIPDKKPLVKDIEVVEKEISELAKKIQQTAKRELDAKKAESNGKITQDYYYVKYGDTLNQLSRRYQVSISSLIQANGISDKNVIEINQKLIIPGHYLGN